jgi:flagellar hook-length control protein FliK
MTLKVSPEDLGPMTVQAHIDGSGVRIELFAPGDAGRDALRSILPELRRGLAEMGLGANLGLSEHGAPSGGDSNGQTGHHNARSHHPPAAPAPGANATPAPASTAVVHSRHGTGVLDILV